MTPHEDPVSHHYGRSGLIPRLLDALQAAGKDPDALSARDLAPFDQFHVRGRDATLHLAHLAGVAAGMQVLDVGGGLGGPARTLAAEFGCVVEVLDVTEEFCRAGAALTARTGLHRAVSFRHASALEMPYPDARFDLVWTQHSSMNVADKKTLYAQIFRVLRPGGRLALHEIMAGKRPPVYYPLPWARGPQMSDLRSPQEIRALLAGLGFAELMWRDETAATLAWFEERLPDTPEEQPAPLGLHLLLGDDYHRMLRNQARSLREGRISVVKGVFEKPRAAC